MRVPVYSLLEWIVRSVLTAVVIGLVGWTLYLDARTLMLHEVKGPPGPKGAVGIAGVTGSQGADGERGDIGPFGPSGPLGVTGPTGVLGPIGATGVTGPLGVTGPTGFGAPSMLGPAGSTGPSGAFVTGPTGPSAGPTGSTGVAGATGSRSLSSLAITYAGATGNLGPSITTSFTPQRPVTPQFPVLAQYAFGPSVSNVGGNTPALTTAGISYRISATLIATLSTSVSGTLNAPMRCQVILTAQDDPATLPASFATETILVARNENVNTYSIALRLMSVYPPPIRVPVVLGFSAIFQCTDLHASAGTLVVSVATLTVVPI